MKQNPKNSNPRDIKRAATIIETAELTGVSVRSVRRILADEQQNPKVFTVFMELKEGKTKLIQAVEALIPFI